MKHEYSCEQCMRDSLRYQHRKSRLIKRADVRRTDVTNCCKCVQHQSNAAIAAALPAPSMVMQPTSSKSATDCHAASQKTVFCQRDG